jgi:hypothetical protein
MIQGIRLGLIQRGVSAIEADFTHSPRRLFRQSVWNSQNQFRTPQPEK